MGQLVRVIASSVSNKGTIRFETNRSFTGMGHEAYRAGEEIIGHRPPDEVARAIFATGQADEVHVYQQMVTVRLAPGASGDEIKDALENVYVYYKPGVEVPTEESFSA